MTDLEERMRLHTPGQVTWPDVKSNKKCSSCHYFTDHGVSESRSALGFGRCDLAKEFLKVPGAQFKGAEAISCHKYKRSLE